MAVAQTPTPKFKNPPPGVCTADNVATEGQNKFVCNGGKWEWFATIPKPPARTVCTDGKVKTINGELYVCSFDHWDSTRSGGAPPPFNNPTPAAPVFDTVTTVPPTVVKEPNKWCDEGRVVDIGDEKFICYHDNYEREKTLDAFATVSIGAGVLVPTPAMDVPAVPYTVHPNYPCEPMGAIGNNVVSVCMTPQDHTAYKCEDTKRVLLTSEDGVKHCILFPAQLVKGDEAANPAIMPLVVPTETKEK